MEFTRTPYTPEVALVADPGTSARRIDVEELTALLASKMESLVKNLNNRFQAQTIQGEL